MDQGEAAGPGRPLDGAADRAAGNAERGAPSRTVAPAMIPVFGWRTVAWDMHTRLGLGWEDIRLKLRPMGFRVKDETLRRMVLGIRRQK